VETISFDGLSAMQREQAAAVLVDALAHAPSAWRDMAEAREQVGQFFHDPERLAIAVLDGDRLIG
jgi:hypothetical protein